MRLTGDLKKKVEKAAKREEAKETIRQAGMELTDEELQNVAGGFRTDTSVYEFLCPYCGENRRDKISILENLSGSNAVKYQCIGIKGPHIFYVRDGISIRKDFFENIGI